MIIPVLVAVVFFYLFVFFLCCFLPLSCDLLVLFFQFCKGGGGVEVGKSERDILF